MEPLPQLCGMEGVRRVALGGMVALFLSQNKSSSSQCWHFLKVLILSLHTLISRFEYWLHKCQLRIDKVKHWHLWFQMNAPLAHSNALPAVISGQEVTTQSTPLLFFSLLSSQAITQRIRRRLEFYGMLRVAWTVAAAMLPLPDVFLLSGSVGFNCHCPPGIFFCFQHICTKYPSSKIMSSI